MISLIYGAKGSGKTKKMIDSANAAIKEVSGTVVYITDKAKHSKELSYNIRFVDAAEYGINNEGSFKGFVKGILASDNDIEKIYIDGLARMTNTELDGLQDIYKTLDELGKKDNVSFYVSVSCDVLPDYLKKYA